MTYKSLKQGWQPLADLCKKYNKDKGNMNRVLKNLNDNYKEQIGRTWVVIESEFVKLINEEFEENVDVRLLISKFAEELSKYFTRQQAKTQLLKINDMQSSEEVMKSFFELAVRCNIEMPMELATALKYEKDFSKQFLIAELWNRICEKEGN